MINFNLRCILDHEFDAWFRSSEDYVEQSAKGFISCPVCGSIEVEKNLMAPAVATSRKSERVGMGFSKAEHELLREWRRIAKNVRKSADYVGENFAEEARKIHFGEADERAIYGEADVQEVTSLLDDGIEIMPLPSLPDEDN